MKSFKVEFTLTHGEDTLTSAKDVTETSKESAIINATNSLEVEYPGCEITEISATEVTK